MFKKIENKVSIVINTYNRLSCLKATLESLEYLRYQNFEVVVVNGPSTDGTGEYLEKNWKGKVKICRCPVANLSVSRNVGICHSSGEIICFIDDDAIPEADWLDEIVNCYNSDNNIGAVGGWVRNNTGIDYQTKYIVSSLDGSSRIDLKDEDEQQNLINLDESNFPGLIGVNSSFRKAALIEVGGFDQEYQYFLDETDVVYRVYSKGWKVKTNPHAEVHHKTAPSHIRKNNNVQKTYLQISKSLSYFILKNNLNHRHLKSIFELIDVKKRETKGNVKFWLKSKWITKSDADRLISEIELGFHQGINDVFKFPLRQTMWKKDDNNEFLQFKTKRNDEDRIHIALVTDLYPPKPCGGVAVFMHSLACELAKRGNEVTVITFDTKFDRVDFEDGVWVHRLAEEKISENKDNVWSIPSSIFNRASRVEDEINRINERRKFDYVLGCIWDLNLATLIQSGNFRTGMYLVTSYKLMLPSKPEWVDNKSFYENHVEKMITAEKKAVATCNDIFASTNAILNDFEKNYEITIPREKVFLIPFGLKRNTIRTVKNEQQIKILFVGRLEKRKGIKELLDVIPRICTKHENCFFDIVGNDRIKNIDGTTYKEDFFKKYKTENWFNRVKFYGEISDSELENKYSQCDIFVAPSLYESFGLIYLEAMRAAKPCVGCNVGGIPEVIQNNVTGLLAQPGNVDSLFEKINKLVECPALRESMGKKGKEVFDNNFSIEIFAERIEKAVKFGLHSNVRNIDAKN